MPEYDKERNSGKTGAWEAGEEAEKGITVDAIQEVLDEEREKRDAMTLAFSRARMEWSKEDQEHWATLKIAADDYLAEAFKGAYVIMNELMDEVCEFQVDPETGEFRVDASGFRIPILSAFGEPIAHWTNLTHDRREHYIFEISTRMFYWRQVKDDMWGESILAKGIATEAFSIRYGEIVGGTIDDRNAYANARSAEHKYFAIYKAYVSRKADGIIDVMNRFAERLVATLKV